MKTKSELLYITLIRQSFQNFLYSYVYKKELTYIVELFEVFYLIKRGEKRTTKRKDRVRVPKMEG